MTLFALEHDEMPSFVFAGVFRQANLVGQSKKRVAANLSVARSWDSSEEVP